MAAMRASARPFSVAPVEVMSGLSSAALAFVPYRTSTGRAFHWPRACVAMRVYVDDLPDATPDGS